MSYPLRPRKEVFLFFRIIRKYADALAKKTHLCYTEYADFRLLFDWRLTMRLLANILWFLLGGAVLALGWLIFGLLLCITIIGIPLGRQCFKAAKLTCFPFGKKVVSRFGAHPIANIIWLLLAGWEMAIGYLAAGVLCCITIIGIPFGLQSFKMMQLAFFPFGAKVI